MNSEDTTAISLIDQQIKDLEKMKAKLLKKQTLSQIVKGKAWLWVIDDRNNTYYQVSFVSDCSVTLKRYGAIYTVHFGEFNDNYRIASSKEFKQHIEFCTSNGKVFTDNNAKLTQEFVEKFNVPVSLEPTNTFDPMKCDFYMVTCRGLMGAKVRHRSYESAEREAIRIAKLNNHETWVVGVVASVKPVEKVVKTITLDTVVRKR